MSAKNIIPTGIGYFLRFMLNFPTGPIDMLISQIKYKTSENENFSKRFLLKTISHFVFNLFPDGGYELDSGHRIIGYKLNVQ